MDIKKMDLPASKKTKKAKRFDKISDFVSQSQSPQEQFSTQVQPEKEAALTVEFRKMMGKLKGKPVYEQN